MRRGIVEKTCNKCHVKKPLSDFHAGTSQCKACKSEYWKEWRKANPDLAKAKDIKGNAARMGVSIDERKRMYDEQDGKCAICHTPGLLYGQGNQKDTLPLDHNHVTGEIRGLLCIKCNRGLGLFMDNPELLREAARYLERRLENVV